MPDPVGRGAADNAATDAVIDAAFDALWKFEYPSGHDDSAAVRRAQQIMRYQVEVCVRAALAAVGSDTPTYEPTGWWLTRHDGAHNDSAHELGCVPFDAVCDRLFRRVPRPSPHDTKDKQ